MKRKGEVDKILDDIEHGTFKSEYPAAMVETDVDFETFLRENFSEPEDIISKEELYKIEYDIDEDTEKELAELQNKYHKYHSTARNPLKDQRVTPIERFNRFMNKVYERGLKGEQLKQATQYARTVLRQEEESGTLAGRWGEFKAD